VNAHIHTTAAHPSYCEKHGRLYYRHTCHHGTGCFDCDLERAVEAAWAALPAECNGRLEKAVELVRAGDVHVNGARAAVRSQSSERIYEIRRSGCQCEDATYRAPTVAGRPACKHMIATWLKRKMNDLGSEPASQAVRVSERRHGELVPYSMHGDNYTAWCKFCETETTWGFGVGCLTCMKPHLEAA